MVPAIIYWKYWRRSRRKKTASPQLSLQLAAAGPLPLTNGQVLTATQARAYARKYAAAYKNT